MTDHPENSAPGPDTDSAALPEAPDTSATEPAQPDPAKPAAAAKPAAKSGGGGAVLTLFTAALLAGGIYYTWTNPVPQPDNPVVAELGRRVHALGEQTAQAASSAASLAQQVQALSDRLDKLEHAAPASGAAPDLGPVNARLDSLAAQIDALSKAPRADGQPAEPAASPQAVTDLAAKLDAAAAAQKAALDQLTDQAKQSVAALATRLDKLEQGAGAVSSTAEHAARLTAIQAAVVALNAGQKLGDIPGAPPALARFATTNPPTETALREEFPGVAAHAREVSRPDVSHKSFLERALTRLQQSVTVRQGDDVLVGDPAAGVLAEAEEKVRIGDLDGAVASLRRLQGPAADAVKDWADRAQALADARAALAAMSAHP